MTIMDRVLDEEGDVLLILQNPNKPFAVWNANEYCHPPRSPWLSGLDVSRFRNLDPRWCADQLEEFAVEAPAETEPAEQPLEAEPAQKGPAEATLQDPEAVSTDDEVLQTRFRLSSTHLILASPYFRAMLRGPWKETTSATSSLRIVYASDWHEDALQILMDILHGNSQKVPRSVTLELLAQIAVVVDYYDCRDAVKFFSDTWFEEIEKKMAPPQEYSRDFMLWFFVSSFFNKAKTMKVLADFAVRAARGPLQTLDLPFPGNLIGM